MTGSSVTRSRSCGGDPQRKALDEAQLAAIEKETREDIEAAVRFAESADEPDLADIVNDVYA
jgi:TPP-dependent pyruvate/acetoin dehydrogenase alpha subunit